MKEEKKKVLLSIVGVLILILLVVGVTYAIFTYSKAGSTVNSITTGTITMTYTEGDNGITINNAMPMKDSVGKTLSDPSQIFDFTININITGKQAVAYEVTAVKQDSSTLLDSEVKLYLEKSTNGTDYQEVMAPSHYTGITEDDEFGAKTGEMVMDTGSTSSTITYYYRLRMWVDESYELNSVAKSFTVKVNVYGKDGTVVNDVEPAPNEPEIVGDMIPVIYDGTSWVKSTTDAGSWYDYDKQKWANVVTIKDSTKRATYKNASVGTAIAISDINTFLVWIPRYSYTLGNTYGYQIDGASTPSVDTPGAFNIKFVSSSTIDTGSGKYTGDNPSGYYTPSSFCWGDTCDTSRSDSGNKELSGIWVSKFEVTGTIDDISSIPNVTSLRNQTVSSYFTGIQSVMNENSGSTNYGFSGNYDTHMMKNTEWGAVAYLSQSKYGKYGNASYTGADKEIYQNKSSEYITGSSNGTPSTSTTNTQVAYNVEKTGTGASTTGNIYGIYDMSGGTVEYVMGNYNNTIRSSLFTSMPSNKYYNLYTTSDATSSIKGDATGADGTNGFYGDNQTYVYANSPWVYRGGSWGENSGAGVFRLGSGYGDGNPGSSARFVLVAE